MNTMTNSPRSLFRCAGIGLFIALMPILQAGIVAAQDKDDSTEQEIPEKVIRMEAENWEWTPNKIRVIEGTRVILEIKGRHAPHRFDLPKYKLKVKIPQGQTTRVEFIADKPGEFTFYCGRPCGDGCPRMTGKLYVVARGDDEAESE